jgi:flavorubredoxin
MTPARELAPGVFWIPACQEHAYMGSLLHSSNSVYLVCGTVCSLLVEAGHPRDLDAIEQELSVLLRAAPELRYVFTTHVQTGNASGAERWLDRWPRAELCGDVRDMHLVFPRLEDRLRPLEVGDALDLGGTEFVAVQAVIRDHASSLWGYDRLRRVLFAGEGFAHGHWHELEHCGKLAEETSALDLPDMTAVFAELTLPWPRLTDMEPYIRRLDDLVLRELDVALIAPAHGLPISDPRATLPRIREGLRLGGRG